ncbi:MAG TPA: tetratricopeptide repeat protein [Candidatus Methanoperedens sp.]|nr:tetratricopeptide repeat protein [Candidatus Methanoperedens sp.]
MNTPARFILGLGFAFVVLLLLESLLGFLPLDRYERGFPAVSYPVFVPGEGESAGSYVTNPHFKSSMNIQRFDRRKARGKTRIFILGSSAAMGWPGNAESAFSGILRRALDSAYPGKFEIVNAAGLSYASHRVLDVLHDVLDHEPDFVLIYSGNNEYVERNVLPPPARSRAARAANRILRDKNIYRSVRLLLHRFAPSLFIRPDGPDLTDLRASPVRRKEPVRNPDVDRDVLENYRKNVAEMAKVLRGRAVRGAICTVPVNLSGWVPTDVFPVFEDAQSRARWNELMRAAFAAYYGNRDAEAERLFRSVAAVSPGYATARFFRGDSLRRLGRYPEAREEYAAACEYDGRPIRELPSFNRSLLAESESLRFPVIDLAEGFAKHRGNDIEGKELFIDYCHPNETGHKVIAGIVLREIVRIMDLREIDGDLVTKRIWDDPVAARYYMSPNVLYARGMTSENNGDLVGAEKYYRETLRVDPGYPEAMGNLGFVLYRRGDRKEAEEYFVRSLEKDPGLANSLMMLGLIRHQGGKLPEAKEYLSRLLRREPDRPDALELMGDIASAEGDWQAARAYYTRVRSAGGDNEPLRRKISGAESAPHDRSRP